MAYDKVVDSAFLEAGLKKVGDSIRAKAGTSELLEFPDAMSAAVDAIDTSKPEQTKTATPSLSQQTIVPDSGKTLSGVTINPITAALLTSLDSDFKAENIAKDANLFGLIGTHAGGGDVEALLTRTVIECENESVKTLGTGAFAYCSSLTSVNFPACTSIGSSAFRECSSLTSVSFPVCTSIGDGAFLSCYSLTSVNFPVCTSVGVEAFLFCSSLTSVSFPVCTSIGSSAFRECSSLTSVSFPVCTSIGNGAFLFCSSLTSVSFPVCTSIGNGAFRYCDSLTSVSFPACTSIGGYAFAYCSSLTTIRLGASTVCTLANSNAFSGTSMSTSRGYIYVPSSLVTSYKQATNWTYFSSRIFAG